MIHDDQLHHAQSRAEEQDTPAPAGTVPPTMQRKLAALLSADVSGYSRLMSEDEEATIRTLMAYRAVMTTLIQRHRGRVVDSPGDNLLAEFASVVDAVRCAIEIQRELKVRNAKVPAQRQMAFRIGINLGDVVVEGERLYGDGVNIAARLEGLAQPGGICLSGTVHDQIENKLALEYEYLGEQAVKNIAKPVRVYRVRLDEAAAALVKGTEAATGRQPRLGQTTSRRQQVMAAVAGLVLLVLVGGALRHLFLQSTPPPVTVPTEQTSGLPLPDKPSIVVLPFTNLSGDLEQEYFSDGLTDVLTGDLSRISSLFVIARHSAFTYKGKPVKVQDVGRELGVQYVLEGSVQKADTRVRITAQLIDATTGFHLWSEQYDRPLQDLFALQDEIVQRIVGTLKLQLTLWEQGVLVRKTTDNLEAYDYVLHSLESFFRTTPEDNLQARQMCERALELDPKYAMAYQCLGWTYFGEWLYGWSHDPQILEQALEMAQQALALDDLLSMAHRLAGMVYLYKKQHAQAIAEIKQAIALDPNEADNYLLLGGMLLYAGRPQEAIGPVEKSMRLNPRHPVWYFESLGWFYFFVERYEEAITALRAAVSRNPYYLYAHVNLAAVYSELGREEEARAEAAEVLRLSPEFSLESLSQRLPFKDPAVLELYLAALRKAGLK